MTWRGWLVAVLLAAGCGSRPQLHSRTRLLMDTYVTISAWTASPHADRVIAAAFERLEDIGRRFNHLDTTSQLSRFNDRQEAITDPEVVAVIAAAESLSLLTEGTFDITVEPLVRIWGFYGDSPGFPPQRLIDSCRQFVGHRNVSAESGRVVKRDPRATIDLGGIAKGYALVTAAGILRAGGIDSAIIDLGGDIFALGLRHGRPWRIGVRNPRGDGVVTVVEVSNRAVVTSGDYERFFFGPDSTRYCHIIDPRTGRPALGTASATVVTDDPLSAQAWSKAVFIFGPSQMDSLARQHGFAAMVISADMTISRTPDFGP